MTILYFGFGNGKTKTDRDSWPHRSIDFCTIPYQVFILSYRGLYINMVQLISKLLIKVELKPKTYTYTLQEQEFSEIESSSLGTYY